MRLRDRVAHAFGAGGPLADLVPALTPRSGQQQMAHAVARVMEGGGVLVAEAGTGIGKTYAYLVPALLSGEQVMVSTATKGLQDQLFNRDIPRLLSVLGVPVRTALLKGRGSYLCLYRLGEARQHVHAMEDTRLRELSLVEMWAEWTRTGDLAELPTLEDDSPVVPLVTSTRENCLGAQCPQAEACFVNLARSAAMASDLVVINHHLYFADLHIRESGVAQLLPSASTVVFDEAHRLHDVGLQCLARQFNTGQIGRFCKDLEHFGPQLALGYDHWRSLVDAVERATADLLEAVSDQSSGRRAWQFNAPAGVDAPAWRRAMADLGESVQAVTHLLETIRETSPPLGSLCERATTIVADIDTFSQEVEPGWVRWLEAGRVLRMFQSPLSLASAWTEQSKALIDSANPGRKSWIFTSATLGHDNELSWFVQSCGLQGADVLRVESPFNYGVQGMLYVPTHLPKSADPSHSADVARLVAQGVQILGGRTLVLTTTLGAMRAIGAALRQHLAGTAEVEVLIQGQHSKRVLLERFRRVVNGTPGGHVLVACVSFWEGIDITGDALQMVVIDKLPFAPPDDPLVGARSKDLRAAGKNPFQNLHLPTAAMALKQGAGRLIRCETDRGILVICDNRLTEASYGKKILAALPPFTTLSCHAHFIEALESLTRTATMNRQTL